MGHPTESASNSPNSGRPDDLLKDLLKLNGELRKIAHIDTIDFPQIPCAIGEGYMTTIQPLCDEHRSAFMRIAAFRRELHEKKQELEKKRGQLASLQRKAEKREKRIQNLLGKNLMNDDPKHKVLLNELRELQSGAAKSEGDIREQSTALENLESLLQQEIDRLEGQITTVTHGLNKKIRQTRMECRQLIDAARDSAQRAASKEPPPPPPPLPPETKAKIPKARAPKIPKQIMTDVIENFVLGRERERTEHPSRDSGAVLSSILQANMQQFQQKNNQGEKSDVAALLSEFTYEDCILDITAREGELFPRDTLQAMLQKCEGCMSTAIGKAVRLASFIAKRAHLQVSDTDIHAAAVRFCATQCRFTESQAQVSKIKEQTASLPGYLHDCIRQIREILQQPQLPLTRRVYLAYGLSILLRHALDRDRHEHIAIQEFAGAQVQCKVRQALEQQYDPATVIRWIEQRIQNVQDFLRQPRSQDVQTDAAAKIRMLTHAKMHLTTGGEHAWNEAYEQEFARLSPEERNDYEGIVDQLSRSGWGDETVELDPYLVRARHYLSQDALNALRSESLAVRSLLHAPAMAFVTLTERKNGLSISDAAGATAIARRLMPLLVDPLEPERRAQRTWQKLKNTRYQNEREHAERLAAYMLIIVERMRDVRAPLTARAFAAEEVAAYCSALERELGFGPATHV